MKRKLFIFLTIIFVILTFTACSSNSTPNFDISDFADEVLESGAFKEKLEPVEADVGCYLYGLSFEDASESPDMLFYMSSGANANELTIFKLPDTDTAASVAESVQRRVDYQIRTFESYSPSEVSKLENCIIKNEDVYVVLIVADDYSAADSVVGKFF